MEEPIPDQLIILVYYLIGQTASPTTPCKEFPLFSPLMVMSSHYPTTAPSTWLRVGAVISSVCSQLVKNMTVEMISFVLHSTCLLACVYVACFLLSRHFTLPCAPPPRHSQHHGLVKATAHSELCTIPSAVSTAALALLASHSVLHYIITSPSPLGC